MPHVLALSLHKLEYKCPMRVLLLFYISALHQFWPGYLYTVPCACGKRKPTIWSMEHAGCRPSWCFGAGPPFHAAFKLLAPFLALKSVNDFLCRSSVKQDVRRAWAQGAFACAHILQMELLNCGLEQCCWNARHWRRNRNEEERRTEGKKRGGEGEGVFSLLRRHRSKVCAVFIPVSYESLMKTVNHFDSAITGARHLLCSCTAPLSNSFKVARLLQHCAAALKCSYKTRQAAMAWHTMKRETTSTLCRIFTKTVYFKMFFTLSMTMCLHSTYSGVGLRFIHKKMSFNRERTKERKGGRGG